MSTNEGRPDREAIEATKTEDDQDLKSASGYDTTAGLRRRRAAANRLPPLPDGHRDPLDPKPKAVQ